MKRQIVIDHSNTNKQLRHYDADGDYMRLSIDETIARGLNAWRNWSCSAGMNNLYIDYDGNLWICNTSSGLNSEGVWATKLVNEGRARKEEVKVDGYLGNILESFALPKNWFRCKWDHCACGADVFIPKARDLSKLAVYHHGLQGRNDTTDQLVDQIEQPVAVEPNFPIPHQILWDLGRKCNYDCSYCWPNAHNRTDPHKSLDVMISTVDRLITEWAENESIRWNFSGGEPTLNPGFLDLLKHLKGRNQWIGVTTNGSRPRSYWREAIQHLNAVNLSVHFEFINEDKLLGNIEEMCSHFDAHNDDHWLEVKLLSPPQFIERALRLKERIIGLDKPGANGRIKGIVSMVPIRSKTDGTILIDYDEADLKIIQNQ